LINRIASSQHHGTTAYDWSVDGLSLSFGWMLKNWHSRLTPIHLVDLFDPQMRH
jgi:hypothetical protein